MKEFYSCILKIIWYFRTVNTAAQLAFLLLNVKSYYASLCLYTFWFETEQHSSFLPGMMSGAATVCS